MTLLRGLALVMLGAIAGAAAFLVVDRLFGGDGPRIELDDEPGGGW